MDHIILGLLILKSRSIYELRECFQAGLNLMYSSSLGSIQATLKKLLRNGFAEVHEEYQGRRVKKIYTITPAGREAFSAWVCSSIKTSSAKNPELGKLYFMAFADPAVRCSNLRKTIEELKVPYEILNAVVHQGETETFPPEAREIVHYQLASARFGRDFLKFQLDWYSQFLKEEEERLK